MELNICLPILKEEENMKFVDIGMKTDIGDIVKYGEYTCIVVQRKALYVEEIKDKVTPKFPIALVALSSGEIVEGFKNLYDCNTSVELLSKNKYAKLILNSEGVM